MRSRGLSKAKAGSGVSSWDLNPRGSWRGSHSPAQGRRSGNWAQVGDSMSHRCQAPSATPVLPTSRKSRAVLSLSVCMCACVCVCMCVCGTCVHMCTCACVCVHVGTCMCVRCTCVRMLCTCACVCVRAWGGHTEVLGLSKQQQETPRRRPPPGGPQLTRSLWFVDPAASFPCPVPGVLGESVPTGHLHPPAWSQ